MEAFFSALAGTLGGSVAVGFISWFFFKGMGAYVSKKGENLANKEDIGALTAEVKKVEHKFNLVLEEVKGRNQLRMAGMDRRLQAHQEAFTHWVRLAGRMHQKDTIDMANKMRIWWQENCVYLEPEVRDAVMDVYHAACTHQDLLEDKRSLRYENATIAERAEAQREIHENWNRIMTFNKLIFAAVSLPKIADDRMQEMIKEPRQDEAEKPAGT